MLVNGIVNFLRRVTTACSVNGKSGDSFVSWEILIHVFCLSTEETSAFDALSIVTATR